VTQGIRLPSTITGDAERVRIGAILLGDILGDILGDAQLDGLGRPWLLASGPRRLVRFSEQAVLTKPRTGTMTERTPGVWRLQVTSEPDVVTGRTRQLSRTARGSTADARRALQRLVTEAGAGLQGGADVTVATLLEQFLTTATLAPTTRQDWTSVIDRHLIPGVGDIRLWRLQRPRLRPAVPPDGARGSRGVARPQRPRGPAPCLRPSRPLGMDRP